MNQPHMKDYDSSRNILQITQASLSISVQVISHATFAAIAKSTVVTSVTENTDLLTPTSVYHARVWYWRKKRSGSL